VLICPETSIESENCEFISAYCGRRALRRTTSMIAAAPSGKNSGSSMGGGGAAKPIAPGGAS
jgi:hypothetical protein